MGRVWLTLSFQAIDGQSRGFNLSAALPASGSLRLVASVSIPPMFRTIAKFKTIPAENYCLQV